MAPRLAPHRCEPPGTSSVSGKVAGRLVWLSASTSLELAAGMWLDVAD